MAYDNVPENKLKPCPFCGSKAKYERMGSAMQSCIIACQTCGCRVETGEVWSCGERWNTRSSEGELKHVKRDAYG